MLTAVDFKFIAHVAKHNLSWATVEEFNARKEIFTAFDDEIERINADTNNTFTVGHNFLSTMNDFEKKKMLGYKEWTSGENEIYEDNAPTADSVDWVKAGAVTGVKDQGQCGSCWSFSSTGALEGAYFIQNGTLDSFSEQQLVDCDHIGSAGCNGGSMAGAFLWYKANKAELESDYSYTATTGTCHDSDYTGVTKDAGYQMVTQSSSSALMASIEAAPTSVAIEADKIAFQGYTSGILNSDACGT
jgi:C1A family cysteine protease